MAAKVLWDVIGKSGRNEIARWGKDLSRKDKGALNQRFEMLASLPLQDSLGLHLLNGPLRGAGNLYKLKAHGDCALRPHLCTGPVDHASEYTVLAGATEKGGKLDPADVEKRCAAIREDLKKNPHRRKPHERY